MRQQNHKRYGRKATGKQQMLKLAVLAFGVVDAVGIYYAHEKLNKPVPSSLQGELLALQQQSQVEAPRVVNPVRNEQLALGQPGISVNPELRFSPSPSVPEADAPGARASAPAPQQLAAAKLPAPVFGNTIHPSVAVAPTAKQPPVVIQTTLAKPAMAIRGNTLTRQVAPVAPTRAVPAFSAAPVVKSIPAPSFAKASPAPMAKASAKVIRQAATTLHATVHKAALHQLAVQPIHHSSVGDQTAAFNSAFADLTNTPDDVLSVQDDQQHVASAPSVVDLPASSAPVSSAELPAAEPAGNSAG
jgi:hypothetical protein